MFYLLDVTWFVTLTKTTHGYFWSHSTPVCEMCIECAECMVHIKKVNGWTLRNTRNNRASVLAVSLECMPSSYTTLTIVTLWHPSIKYTVAFILVIYQSTKHTIILLSARAVTSSLQATAFLLNITIFKVLFISFKVAYYAFFPNSTFPSKKQLQTIRNLITKRLS